MVHSIYDPGQDCRPAWNAGRKLGAKRPLQPKQVWAVRFWLEQEHRSRDQALFDLAIDSKLRGCDLVKDRIGLLDRGPSGDAVDFETSRAFYGSMGHAIAP